MNKTVLDTDTYKVKVDEWNWNMYIYSAVRARYIPWCKYKYDLNDDFIVEYNTKKFKGFVVLDNGGKIGLFLNVVKVNLEYDNLVESIHRYKIERYESDKDIVLFRYDKETKKFSIICKKFPDLIFKLKDLEIVSKMKLFNKTK